MKNVIIGIFIMILGGLGLYAEKVAVLPEVNKPSMIDVAQDRLFVMDMEKVRVYSLKGFKLINSFGKKGSGPGEYQVVPTMPMRILATAKTLNVESLNKILIFDHDGIFKRELKKLPMINIVQPVGKNFAARRIIQPQDGSRSISTVRLYDQNLKEIKSLFEQDFIQQGGFPSIKIDMGQEFLLFKVYDNKIFIDESARGPFIGVYDENGKRLYEIKVPYQNLKIDTVYKKRIEKDISQDPHVLWQLKQNNTTWDQFRQFFDFKYSKYFPAIQTLDIDRGKIYIKTFKMQGEKSEYIIMDLKGNVLKTMYMAPTVKKWIMSTMMGINLEIIADGKIYYVIENDSEQWELYIQDIK